MERGVVLVGDVRLSRDSGRARRGHALERRGRGAVADLVVELEQTPPGLVRNALARALGDPSLELALWLPDRAAYVDGEGRPFDVPASGSGRSVTVLGRPRLRWRRSCTIRRCWSGRPCSRRLGRRRVWRWRTSVFRQSCGCNWLRRAPCGHGSSTPATPSAAGSSATCTTARSSACWPGPGVAARADQSSGLVRTGRGTLLGEAEAELAAALAELRELARGIHPRCSDRAGARACAQLPAARSPLPVEIRQLPAERLSRRWSPPPTSWSPRRWRTSPNTHSQAGLRLGAPERKARGGGRGRRRRWRRPKAGSGPAGLANRVHALEGRLHNRERARTRDPPTCRLAARPDSPSTLDAGSTRRFGTFDRQARPDCTGRDRRGLAARPRGSQQ